MVACSPKGYAPFVRQNQLLESHPVGMTSMAYQTEQELVIVEQLSNRKYMVTSFFFLKKKKEREKFSSWQIQR